MKTLTQKEAIAEGYTHCGKHQDSWQSLIAIEDLDEIDFVNDDDWYLAEKEPKPFTFGKDQIADLLSDTIGENESEYSGRDTDDIYEAIKAIDFSETETLINDVLAKHTVYFLTDIQLVYENNPPNKKQ